MLITVTANYDSIDKVRGAEDDLRTKGLPSEKRFVDEDALQIKVLCPEVTKPEILELLGRHNPTSLE